MRRRRPPDMAWNASSAWSHIINVPIGPLGRAGRAARGLRVVDGRVGQRAAIALPRSWHAGPVDLVIPQFTGVGVDGVVLGRIRLSAPIGKKTTDSRPAQTSAAAVTDVISSIATPIWVAATMKGSDVA